MSGEEVIWSLSDDHIKNVFGFLPDVAIFTFMQLFLLNTLFRPLHSLLSTLLKTEAKYSFKFGGNIHIIFNLQLENIC